MNFWIGIVDVYWSSPKLAMEITKNDKKGDALVIGEDQFHYWIKFKLNVLRTTRNSVTTKNKITNCLQR